VAETIVELLRSNYDEMHGVVNVRPVVDRLLKSPDRAFADVAAAFKTAEPRWRLPMVEAMRTLAATGYCNENQAPDLIRATEAVAVDSGTDEYFKTVNAMVSSRKTAGALLFFVERLLESGKSTAFARQLAFYTVGMLLDHQTAQVSPGLRVALSLAATAESSDQMKDQFAQVVSRL